MILEFTSGDICGLYVRVMNARIRNFNELALIAKRFPK